MRAEPVPATWGDVRKALCGFIQTFAAPELPEGRVFWGNQNRMHLPADSQDFVIMTPISQSRTGTNVENFSAEGLPHGEAGTLTIMELITCDIQLDFYSDGDEARQRAQAIETVARSSAGVDFLRKYGISCLYAEDVRELTEPLDAYEYVCRSMTVIRLQFWTGVKQELPWFDSVGLGVHNVDVIWPPQGGTPSAPPRTQAVHGTSAEPFRFLETDPTVPDWAKQPEKPVYTAGEVGALSSDARVTVEDDDGDEDVTITIRQE